MAEPIVHTTSPVSGSSSAPSPGGAWLEQLADRAVEFDFFQAMRVIDCAHPDAPRMGEARRPADEPVRISQPASLAFAASAIANFQPVSASGDPAKLEINCFGLFGPNGALPLHLTEYARQRELHEGDRTFARFLDVFHHRLASLFYRAWAVNQQVVSFDRPTADSFARYLRSLIGLGTDSLDDAVDSTAKVHYAGHLAHRAKSAGGLARIIGDYFGVPTVLEEFVARQPQIDPTEWAILGRDRRSATVGRGLVLGARVTDVQFSFRIHMGPLDWNGFRALLPGGAAIRLLRDWVRNYCNFEFRYDVRLTLRAKDVRAAQLGGSDRPGMLGWSTWLATRPSPVDRDDLTLDVERYV